MGPWVGALAGPNHSMCTTSQARVLTRNSAITFRWHSETRFSAHIRQNGAIELSQPADEQFTGLLEQRPIRTVPIIQVAKQIAELEERTICDSVMGKQSFDALIRRPCLDEGAHTGTIRPNPHVRDSANAMRNQEAGKLIRRPSAITDGVKLHAAARATRDQSEDPSITPLTFSPR